MSLGLNSMNEAIKKLFIGPDTIFAGDVKLLNANIFDTTDISQISDITNMVVDENTGTLSVTETVTTLSNAVSPGYRMIVKIREAIASTYTAIRDVCGYIMLAGLIFTGIKILLGSNIPSKNTRWLEALQDWLIGMALLIFSHIIMIGIFTLSDLLSDGLSGTLYGIGSVNFTLIHQCLLSWDSAEQIIYLVMLGYLIYLTVVFVVAYFKRLLWVCVLIVIAPIVSIMYAFGHETKRIYTSWLREYIMTVLVQPFHLIVYYILVSIPLNMVNSTGQFNFTSDGFTIIYALGAMSFIRPAEKYIRQLFGMDKGIANMASFDSGKQTIDAAKKAVEDFGKKLVGVVKTAAIVVASIYTGGAAGAAAGAAGGAGAAGAAGGAGAAGAAGGAGGAGGLLGSGAAGGAGGAEGLLGSGAAEGAGGLFGGDGMGSLGEGPGNLLDFGTTGPMQEDPSFSFSPSSMGGAMEDFPDEDPLRLSRREALEEQLADGQITEDDLSQEDRDLLKQKDKVDSTEEAKEKLKETTEGTKEDQINANNVTITASNVNMQGNNIENLGNETIKTVDGEEDNNPNDEENNENDDTNEKKDDIEIIDRPDLFGTLKNVGFGEDLKDLGNEAYKGINSVRDTFYVDNGAPKDWGDKAKRYDEKIKEKKDKRKEKNEREKTAWSKDKNNINFIIEQKGYMKELREQYPDKKRYPDAYLRSKAEEKAEKDLQKMSDYVPYGVRDVRQAYEYSQLAKNYGYTPEEAIRAHAGYERFNNDPENIAYINQAYQVDVSSVSEAIPDSKDYYHNGYDNISDMRWVDYMATRLDRTPDYAMDIDRALRKKGGKIKYNGENSELKDIIEQINEHYGK